MVCKLWSPRILLVCLLFSFVSMRAQEPEEASTELTTSIFLSDGHPSGSLMEDAGDHDFLLNESLGFNNYPLASGLVDWRFKNRQHIFFAFSLTRFPDPLC